MIKLDYLQLMRDLCAHAGIEAWEQVAQAEHLEIDGVTTGLLHDEVNSPDVLSICFELDVLHDPEVAKRLLEYNTLVLADSNGAGRFGLLNDHIVYRVDMPWLPSLDGTALSACIGVHLHAARHALGRCISAAD